MASYTIITEYFPTIVINPLNFSRYPTAVYYIQTNWSMVNKNIDDTRVHSFSHFKQLHKRNQFLYNCILLFIRSFLVWNLWTAPCALSCRRVSFSFHNGSSIRFNDTYNDDRVVYKVTSEFITPAIMSRSTVACLIFPSDSLPFLFRFVWEN